MILPRYPEQVGALQELALPNCLIPAEAIDARALMYESDLVIGAGGTMSREAALLGVPTVSVFAGRQPAVDRWLEEGGALRRLSSVEQLGPVGGGPRIRPRWRSSGTPARRRSPPSSTRSSSPLAMAPELAEVLARLERWGAERDWIGADPYEGLNSALGRLAPTRRTRQAVTQLYKRLRIQPREPLRAPLRPNAKALALVLSGYATAAGRRLPGADRYLVEIPRRLAEMNLLKGAAGWGYHFDVQTRNSLTTHGRRTRSRLASSSGRSATSTRGRERGRRGTWRSRRGPSSCRCSPTPSTVRSSPTSLAARR